MRARAAVASLAAGIAVKGAWWLSSACSILRWEHLLGLFPVLVALFMALLVVLSVNLAE
ncbi:MAG: hypothetical protein AB8B57_17190 [Congregibacter sp.]